MKKIQVESPMRKASEDRIEEYQPVYDCLPLVPETSSGEASYTNLIRLKEHGLRVVGVEVTLMGSSSSLKRAKHSMPQDSKS